MAAHQNFTCLAEVEAGFLQLDARRADLEATAAQHIHAQQVPPCTHAQGGQHNINCGRLLDTSVIEHHALVSKGLVPVKSYEEWGCESEAEETHRRDIANMRVRMAFAPVEWDRGFTGRGINQQSLDVTDAIGPFGEIESTGMSPLELNGLPEGQRERSRTIGTGAEDIDSNVEELSSYRQSEGLNGGEVGGILPNCERQGFINGGHTGERDDGNEVDSGEVFTPQADATRQMMGALDEIANDAPGRSSPGSEVGATEASIDEAAHDLLKGFKTTPMIGTKRGRESSSSSDDGDSEDDESVLRAKRRCTTRIERTYNLGPVRDTLKYVGKQGTQQLNTTEDAAKVVSPQTSKKRDRNVFEATDLGKDDSASKSLANNKRVRRCGQRETNPPEVVNGPMTQVSSHGNQRSLASTTKTTSDSNGSTGDLEKGGEADTSQSSLSNLNDGHLSNKACEPVVHIIQFKTEDEDRNSIDEIDDTSPMNVRPTYEGSRCRRNADGNITEIKIPELNEADEIVVMNVQGKGGRIPYIHQPETHQPWTTEDDEKLRSSVQDYGIENWPIIAWCLRRQIHECQRRYCLIVAERNRRGGRHPHAGLPKNLTPVTVNNVSQEKVATSTADAISAHSETPLGVIPAPAPAPTQTPSRPAPVTTPASIRLPAAVLPVSSLAGKSDRVLRPRTQHAVPRFQCGKIVYDPKLRSLPKVSDNGTIVDSKGNVVLGTEREVRMALKNKQPRRKARGNLMLNANPHFNGNTDNAPTPSVPRVSGARVAKRKGRKGVRR